MADPSVREMSQCHAPGLADRLFAARHADAAEMSRAAKPAVIADQEFAAPDGPVGAEAGAVERHADDRLVQSMLGHATRHVRMVMLDGEHAASCLGRSLPGIARRGVIGVQVVDQMLRPDAEQLLRTGRCR